MANQRARARQSVTRFARRLQRAIVTGQFGNNVGTVDHPTRTNWVWVRLHGDSNQVIAAHCPATAGVIHQADIVVALERVSRSAAPYYEVLGLATGILYPGNDFEELIGPHAAQHERRNFGQGGPDPVDVYPRALTGLRGRAQTVPNWTAYVEVGLYQNSTGAHVWAGGNSPALTPPAGTPMTVARRCDLLYLNNADALAWQTGTATYDGSVPTRPTVPGDAAVIFYAYLDSTMTALTEECIYDPGHSGIATLPATLAPTPHNMLSASHVDSVAAAAVRGDVLYANATPAWARLAKGTAGQFFKTDGTDVLWSSFKLKVTTVTDATYTVLASDDIVICNRATAQTITLPASSGGGKVCMIKQIGVGLVTIARAGSDTIDGETSIALGQWATAQLVDGAAGAFYIL